MTATKHKVSETLSVRGNMGRSTRAGSLPSTAIFSPVGCSPTILKEQSRSRHGPGWWVHPKWWASKVVRLWVSVRSPAQRTTWPGIGMTTTQLWHSPAGPQWQESWLKVAPKGREECLLRPRHKVLSSQWLLSASWPWVASYTPGRGGVHSRPWHAINN